MNIFIFGLIIGLLIGGILVQYRITNDIWGRKTFEDIRIETINNFCKEGGISVNGYCCDPPKECEVIK